MNLVIFGDRSLRPTVTSMQMFVVVAEGFVVGYVFVEGALFLCFSYVTTFDVDDEKSENDD